MMRSSLLLSIMLNATMLFAQVDTTFIFNLSTPYGKLDIRLARSSSEYYYLQHGETFSFRQSDNKPTKSFLDMTSWDSEAYQQGHMRLKAGGSDEFVMNYRLLLPENYEESSSTDYPIVIVLHGLRESGNCAGSDCHHSNVNYDPNENTPPAPISQDSKLLNNDYNLVHGGQNYLDAREAASGFKPDAGDLPANAFPGFVLFPQNLRGWDIESAEDAIRVLRLIIKKYRIDKNRVYINGISNGGRGAYEVLKRAPWLFAAGVLFSAADDSYVTRDNHEDIVSKVPLWIFQGGIDNLPTQQQTESYIRQLRTAGANIRYTIYPEIGHATWTKGMSEPDFFSWMLGKRSNDIHVFANTPIICGTSGIGPALSLPKGYPEYQWEFNGVVQESLRSSTITATKPGIYKGRYMTIEKDWSDWSQTVNVSVTTPQTPLVVQSGTVILKDPNGGNKVQLSASDPSADFFYWYKNGKRINFPGGNDEGMRVAEITSSFGDGEYTLRTATFNNCLSAPSEAKHIFFDDRAPKNITAPGDVQVRDVKASSLTVAWNDRSDNEDAFEIWRTSDNEEGLWTLASITDENTTSFSDKGLIPSTSYRYMVRAVSKEGRSEYTNGTSIKTPEDDETPSSPSDASAKFVSPKKILLHWSPSLDNAGIREYRVFFGDDTLHTGSSDTSIVVTDFELNRNYAITIDAVDVGGNPSAPSPQVEIETRFAGLSYQHSTGEWTSLDQVDWAVSEFEGVTDNFSLEPKTQDDFFNFRFDGYLYIHKKGVYQFRLSSNDGSRLYLDDSLTIVNDGIHNLATVVSPVQVYPEGPHRITVDFFDSMLEDSLTVEYKGPDTEQLWTLIPSSNLSSDSIYVSDPDNGIADVNLFPNPLNNQPLNFVHNGDSTEDISLTFLSSNGMIQSSYKIPEVRPGAVVSVPVTNAFPDGLYFVQIITRQRRQTIKLIIDR